MLDHRGLLSLGETPVLLNSSSLVLVWFITELQRHGEQTWLSEAQCLRIYTAQVLAGSHLICEGGECQPPHVAVSQFLQRNYLGFLF